MKPEDTRKMKPEDTHKLRPESIRLIIYVICFSIAPAILICIIVDECSFIKKNSDMMGPFFFLVAIFLFGVVLSVVRMVNRPKPPAKVIERIIIQQKQTTQQTPVRQTQEEPVNTPKPT